jgi:hypothetical protein
MGTAASPHERSSPQPIPYYDAVHAPLVSVTPADGCVVTVDEGGNVVSRDLGSGRVVAVMQPRMSVDACVVCLCHVSRSVREQLVGGGSEDFPAFFVAHQGGCVGVYTHALSFMYNLNPLPPLPPPAPTDVSITCMACAIPRP